MQKSDTLSGAGKVGPYWGMVVHVGNFRVYPRAPYVLDIFSTIFPYNQIFYQEVKVIKNKFTVMIG